MGEWGPNTMRVFNYFGLSRHAVGRALSDGESESTQKLEPNEVTANKNERETGCRGTVSESAI